MDHPTLPPVFADAFAVPSSGGFAIATYRLLDAPDAPDAPDRGPAGTPALLFAHANGFNAGCYQPFLARLAGHFQVFAYDARGHGASPSPLDDIIGDYAMLRFAEDLAAIVDHVRGIIGPDVPLHFASHSLGGLAAVLLAAEMGREPFASLTMFEPPIHPPEGHPERAAIMIHSPKFVAWAARRRNQFPDRAALRDEVENIMTYRRFTDEMMAAYLDAAVAPAGAGAPGADGGLELRCPGPVESAIYSNCPDSGIFEMTKKVTTRARIYASDQAVQPELHSWAPATMASIAETMANGECRTMPGCLHLMIQEDPDACAAAVVDHALNGRDTR